ncbi:hypothetical protein TCAL_07548 [Tigriopus californicus]|uniref:Uncharacterized protein n=1 Tax=Tigriopus californicus TaxID=6832 RepID=A0A553PQM0_TIGCA|nr:uncharacterized protein LOC131881729 [Tigriopus californicus]TRY79979.1 hypothetical protein TCAL_07548 [Tigriopus californicus]|eukprot:TCALIF_07548-PA protein Name:"Protein of unknown function" AED:0.00 eAED:0.00 QI:44/1/1/1/0/0.5/2/399/118
MKPLLAFLALIATFLQSSMTVVCAGSTSMSGVKCFPRYPGEDDSSAESSYICIFPPGFKRASRVPEILDVSIAPEANFQDPVYPNTMSRRSTLMKLKPKPKSYNVAFPSGSRLLPRLY